MGVALVSSALLWFSYKVPSFNQEDEKAVDHVIAADRERLDAIRASVAAYRDTAISWSDDAHRLRASGALPDAVKSAERIGRTYNDAADSLQRYVVMWIGLQQRDTVQILQPLIERQHRRRIMGTLATILAGLILLATLFVTWLWYAPRSTVTATPAPLTVPGRSAARFNFRIFALVSRIDTPAPKSEKAGFILFVLSSVFTAVASIVMAVDGGRVIFGAVFVLPFIALPVMPFIRKKWAFTVLFTELSFMAVAMVIILMYSVFYDREYVARALWWFVWVELYLCYFWRRRWWYGFEMPAARLDSFPLPSARQLTVECFVVAFALLLAANVARELLH